MNKKQPAKEFKKHEKKIPPQRNISIEGELDFGAEFYPPKEILGETFAEVVLPIPVDRKFHYRIPKELEGKVKVGIRVEVPFGSKPKTGYVTALTDRSEYHEIKSIISIIDEEPPINDKLLALAEFLSFNYMCTLGEALATILPVNLKSPKRAAKKEEKAVQPLAQTGPKLTTAQTSVLNEITSSMHSKTYQSYVLCGITGSGKTEVYLSCMQKAIDDGAGAVYLLPEISLTPQFINIVQKRFPGVVGVWHSRLTPGQRYRTWDAARKGEIKIMLGARSAVFAPFKRVGVIIVDEEHEPTYKQEQKPAYQTRDVAKERAKIENAVVVFGSATPSLESYYGTKIGVSKALYLNERIDSRKLPKVELVDLKKYRIKSRILTPLLKEAITKTLARREQAIIFLNRRGFSPSVVCQQCGNTWQCPRCSVSLVYHKPTNDLRCHYCGYIHPWTGLCPTCKNADLSVFGIGTQKVESELKTLFPQARTFRLDRDTASKKDVYFHAYQEFKDENYDILLGTQMVAKGFDFPRVTLVGVIDADTALFLPDFRAAERTFQLITQVAGRCGRGDLGGEVIVQTTYPDHYAILAAKDHDYEKFYNQEIAYRLQAKYPPFTRLVNILVRASKEERAIESINRICDDLRKYMLKNNVKFELLGPSPAAHAKLRRLFRWQVLLKGSSEDVLNAAREIRSFYLPKGILINVDVDPQAVL